MAERNLVTAPAVGNCKLDNIPAELRVLKQWVVWRAVVRGDRVTKPPFRPSDPSREASVNDPTTWGTFDEAVACWQANPSVVSGIGFVFTEGDDYVGIDLDTIRKVLQEHVELRQQFETWLEANAISYTERSPSGEGLHIIGRGRLPRAGEQDTRLKWEIYAYNRFFTFTGEVVNGRSTLHDLQPFIDTIQFRTDTETAAPEDQPSFRNMELSDEAVVQLTAAANPTFAARFNGLKDCDAGDWSETFMAVVGALDKVTGRVEQLKRIVISSGMVQHTSPASTGERRIIKAARIFNTTLARVRRGNNALAPFIEHGRQQAENMERYKAEQLALQLAEALTLAEEAKAELTQGAIKVIDAFPQLKHECRALLPPPGVVGEFVRATEAACHKPFLKYAIPSTLSALSGIVGRGYKVDDGGLNVNFILLAPSAAGKTNTMDAWEGFIAQANAGVPSSSSGPPPRRIIKNSTSSIQGMMPDFMIMPSCAWYVEEAGSQVELMTSKTNPQGPPLRDKYNELYGCSRHDAEFKAPNSKQNEKDGIKSIRNLNVSTFWTTTPEKCDLSDKDALDGFLSRVTVIRHKGQRSGNLNLNPVKKLPEHLLRELQARLAAATALDNAYRADPNGAAAKLTPVSMTASARSLFKEFLCTADQIVNDAHDEKISGVYATVSRLPPIAQRIAAVLAVMDSPYSPTITEEHLRWSFGYVLQNRVALLSSMDRGEIGDGAKDARATVTRTILNLMRHTKHKQGVATKPLKDALKKLQPFVGHPDQYGSMTKTLDGMKEDGLIDTTEQVEGRTPGKNPTLYFLTREGLHS